MAVIVAKGAKLGEAKASNALADILVVRLPRKRVELKHRHTSGIIKCPAMSKESSRFSSASFLLSEKGTCEPVRMTGFPRFCNMKLNAEQVYAKLSVPCKTTKPSKSI